MRTGDDTLRSLRQFMWRAFENDVPPLWQDKQRDWEVRLWGSEGTFGFPFVRVAAITPVTYTGPATWREATRTFAVHAYPVPMADPESSIMEAERIEEILFSAFEVGMTYTDQVNVADPTTWLNVKSGPRRLPLYDFDGVPLDGVGSVSYARGPNDFLRVLDCPVERIVDPEDDRYWLVTAQPRISWRRVGKPIDGTKVVADVILTMEGS